MPTDAQSRHAENVSALIVAVDQLLALSQRMVADLTDADFQAITALRHEVLELSQARAAGLARLAAALKVLLEQVWADQEALRQALESRPLDLAALREIVSRLEAAERLVLEDAVVGVSQSAPLGHRPFFERPPEAEPPLPLASVKPTPPASTQPEAKYNPEGESTLSSEAVANGDNPITLEIAPAEAAVRVTPNEIDILAGDEPPVLQSETSDIPPFMNGPVSEASASDAAASLVLSKPSASRTAAAAPETQAPKADAFSDGAEATSTPQAEPTATPHRSEPVPDTALQPADAAPIPVVPHHAPANAILATREAWLPRFREWEELPRLYLLMRWLASERPSDAERYPSPELCELAYYAFQPGTGSEAIKCPELGSLEPAMTSTWVPLCGAAWTVAAALMLLQGQPVWPSVKQMAWIEDPDLQHWTRLVEAVSLYHRYTSEPVDTILRAARTRTPPANTQQDRDAARKVLASLTNPRRFTFLKGQRLTNHLEAQFEWLRSDLKRPAPSDAVRVWVSDFDPEKRLAQWVREVKPYNVPIDGTAMRGLVRDFKALQHHAQRWLKAHHMADSSSKDHVEVWVTALRQLAQTLVQEGAVWERNWQSLPPDVAVLAGWSGLLVQRLSEACRPLLAEPGGTK